MADFNSTKVFDDVPQFGKTGMYEHEDVECDQSSSDTDSSTSFHQSDKLDEFESDSTPEANSSMLGDQIMSFWHYRAKSLAHPYAIVAWFCSVDPNVYKDVLRQ